MTIAGNKPNLIFPTQSSGIKFPKINPEETIGLFFDIDELLVDNRHEIHRAYKMLVESYRVVPDESEAFPGSNLFEILDNLRKKYQINDSVESMAEKRRGIYLDILNCSEFRIKPGVREVFHFIHQYRSTLNILIGYVTSSERAFVEVILRKIFSSIGLSHCESIFFDNVNNRPVSTHWEPNLKKKPSPDLYLSSLAKIGIKPEQCIAFEDSISGSRSALAAGLNLVLIPSFLEGVERDLGLASFEDRIWVMNSMLEFIPYLRSLQKEKRS